MAPALSDLGPTFDVSSIVFTLPPVIDLTYFADGDPPRTRDVPLYVLFLRLTI
jgi:hypothetical protein